jgi:hypothetical protein
MKWGDARTLSLSALGVSIGVLVLLLLRFLNAGRCFPLAMIDKSHAREDDRLRSTSLVSGHKSWPDLSPSALHGLGKGPLHWA